MMRNKKIILILLIALIIIVIAGYLLFVQKTASQNINQNSNQPATIATQKVEYQNPDYGFTIALPDSWADYSVLTESWQGSSNTAEQGDVVVEQGPLISIRHPQWTKEIPRQDIPIMVFTLDQWDNLQQEKFHIGAAPIGPREFSRNAKYVLALPARYNFAFPVGYEEVDQIVNSNPLKTF